MGEEREGGKEESMVIVGKRGMTNKKNWHDDYKILRSFVPCGRDA